MNINEFDYYLPEDRIAQTPLKNRSDSKLMILDKKTGAIKHEIFKNIYNYLEQGDVLVLNDTKVIPARLIGVKEDTKAHMELLLLNDQGDNVWECLARPCKRLHNGTIISFGDGSLKAQVLAILGDGIVHVKLLYEGILFEILDKLGEMPLPPYIHTKLKDQSRYQTVYAEITGSAAAPTAGLHFTKNF
jgi:S-adenosylmethionine:tRNA ribosyltransferase-isomerase